MKTTVHRVTPSGVALVKKEGERDSSTPTRNATDVGPSSYIALCGQIVDTFLEIRDLSKAEKLDELLRDEIPLDVTRE